MLKHKSPLLEEVELNVKCTFCGSEHKIVVVKQDFMDFYTRNKKAQEALPYLSADERELLISHVCPECFDELLGGEEE